jgi:hypothetical protein
MANTSGKSTRGSQRGGASNRRSDEERGMRAQGSERSQRHEGRSASSRSGSRSGAGNGGRNRKGSSR